MPSKAYLERVAIDACADGAFTAVVRIDGTLPAARLTGRIETLDGTPDCQDPVRVTTGYRLASRTR